MTTLYRGGRIFDGARMVDGHAVLVVDGRIARVAPEGEFDGFAGEEVDCTGGTVMPGLIDCHVHVLFRGEPDPMSALEKLDAAHAVVRALENAAGTPFNLHGHNSDELRFMVDIGLSNLDALRAGTRNAADLMRLDDRGRIAEGAAADLLVVSGDPSTDIAAAADRECHRRVVRNGIVVNGDAVAA